MTASSTAPMHKRFERRPKPAPVVATTAPPVLTLTPTPIDPILVTPQLTSHAEQPTPTVVSTDTLQPDAVAMHQLGQTQEQNIPHIQMNARQVALRTMNALRTLSPAIRHAMATQSKSPEQAVLFTEMMQAARTSSNNTLSQLELDPLDRNNQWMVNVLDRVFIEAMTLPLPPAHEPLNIPQIQTLIAHTLHRGMEEQPFGALDDSIKVKTAIIQATRPILLAQMRYDFYRDRDADLQYSMEYLIKTVVDAIPEMIDPIAKMEDRVVFFQILLTEAAEGLAACWDAEAKKWEAERMNRSHAEWESILNANPSGLPTAPVFTQFGFFFQRLLFLTKQHTKAPKKK